ncbi:ADP compounds hydrolase NudE [Amphritea balenae]|uniref:ADP compounds hydrolase NudE n=1 Tax=Amphritea balenae TaxID=452629 RepID=A0A3P1SKH0_9GAMM|nr:ADP compounds hydrolase NudE [Amphritea balenae]RRC97434.1 ADP compounds hydrolase NudE [Amphritea balenae]GGK84417.1 ADP-ribose diphosphatase NudE [Amphritea balenae]
MPVKPDILKVTATAKSRLFQVEEIELRFSNGVERTYERLATRGRGAVMIAAIDEQENVLLIKEYAVGLEDYLLTLPKGLIDPGEDAIEAANRELKEEAGFGAERLEVIKQMTSAPNYMGHKITSVLARGLYPCRLEGDEPEEMEVMRWPLSQLDKLFQREDFSEARAIAALYMIRDKLKQE